jgi:AraC-like DNA-binding protein
MNSPMNTTAFFAEANILLEAVRHPMRQDQEASCGAAVHLRKFRAPPALARHATILGGLAPWQKRKVEQFLAENLERGPRLKELAGHIPLSVSHFSRLFKESFGITPHMHIMRLKLKAAQQRMLFTNDALSQIALSCGLSDQAHLSKVFRRCVGETPSAWRRRVLAEVA